MGSGPGVDHLWAASKLAISTYLGTEYYRPLMAKVCRRSAANAKRRRKTGAAGQGQKWESMRRCDSETIPYSPLLHLPLSRALALLREILLQWRCRYLIQGTNKCRSRQFVCRAVLNSSRDTVESTNDKFTSRMGGLRRFALFLMSREAARLQVNPAPC